MTFWHDTPILKHRKLSSSEHCSAVAVVIKHTQCVLKGDNDSEGLLSCNEYICPELSLL